jgi:hypothetical protein
MINTKPMLALVASAGLLSACGGNDADPVQPPDSSVPKVAPYSLAGATCALVPEEGWTGGWDQVDEMSVCLRQLAYKDWEQASSEAAHISSWPRNGILGELVIALTHYESADGVRADLKARGLLGGSGEPDFLEYRPDAWQPLTADDWLMKEGRWYGFDAETGTFPNNHDHLLSDLARLFGGVMANARFRETPPVDWESEDPYQVYASLRDLTWTRQAENYSDWYDTDAVIHLLNEMASDLGDPQRIIMLETHDQTAIVIVGPGESLVAAATEGLINPAGADDAGERGKAFEDKVRRLYGIPE